MEGFKPLLDEFEERLGAFTAEDESNLTLHLESGERIGANAVGIDHHEGAATCYHFTWEEFEEETFREVSEEQDIPFEELKEEVSFGEPVMILNGIIPFSNISQITMDTSKVLE